MKWLQDRAPEPRKTIGDAISFAACTLAHDLDASAIITPTDSGSTARLVSRFRPRAPIIGVSARREIWRQLSLTWGVFPLLIPELRDTDQVIQAVEKEAKDAGWLRNEEKVVIATGTPFGERGVTNLIKADIL